MGCMRCIVSILCMDSWCMGSSEWYMGSSEWYMGSSEWCMGSSGV